MQVPVTPGPPPAYDAVVPIHKNIVSPARTSPHEQQFLQHQQLAAQQRRPPPSSDDSGLPSYEAALRLEVGHVLLAKVHCPPVSFHARPHNVLLENGISAAKKLMCCVSTSSAAALRLVWFSSTASHNHKPLFIILHPGSQLSHLIMRNVTQC